MYSKHLTHLIWLVTVWLNNSNWFNNTVWKDADPDRRRTPTQCTLKYANTIQKGIWSFFLTHTQSDSVGISSRACLRAAVWSIHNRGFTASPAWNKELMAAFTVLFSNLQIFVPFFTLFLWKALIVKQQQKVSCLRETLQCSSEYERLLTEISSYVSEYCGSTNGSFKVKGYNSFWKYNFQCTCIHLKFQNKCKWNNLNLIDKVKWAELMKIVKKIKPVKMITLLTLVY